MAAGIDNAAIVCRCEEVTAGVLRTYFRMGHNTPAALKRATRAGMGRCQGRYCASVIARLCSNEVDEFGLFAPRPPAKPVPIHALSDKTADDRRSQVSELVQGALISTATPGGADQRRRRRGSARLVADQRDEGRGARRREPGSRLQAPACPATFTPGTPGWLGEVEPCIASARSPNPRKGYTVGDNTHGRGSGAASVAHRATRSSSTPSAKDPESGQDIVCVHMGLTPTVTQRLPHLTQNATVRRCRQGGEGWPQIRCVDRPPAYPLDRRRRAGAPAVYAVRTKTGRVDWTTRPRRDPRRSTASATSTPTWADLAQTTMTGRGCAPVPDGHADQGAWASSLSCGAPTRRRTGAPRWQIETLRGRRVRDDLQTKIEYAPLGAAPTVPVQAAIFGENSAKMYTLRHQEGAWRDDRFAAIKSRSTSAHGREPSNLGSGSSFHRVDTVGSGVSTSGCTARRRQPVAQLPTRRPKCVRLAESESSLDISLETRVLPVAEGRPRSSTSWLIKMDGSISGRPRGRAASGRSHFWNRPRPAEPLIRPSSITTSPRDRVITG